MTYDLHRADQKFLSINNKRKCDIPEVHTEGISSFPVPPDAVLCAMKISAMLARSKGGDYYDTMFLLSQTKPDYSFLTARCGIRNLPELKEAVATSLHSIDLNHKQRDFEHLLFNRRNSERIQQFPEFIRSLS